MKKYWLRGVLLGVSMALLLAGGVALAAGYWLTAFPSCVVCVPPDQVDGPRPDQILVLEAGGWDAGDRVCVLLTLNSEILEDICDTEESGEPQRAEHHFSCELNGGILDEETSAANLDTELGLYVLSVWPEGQPALGAEASWLVVRDKSECPVEFVPEPGSILLLGSGLVGLAGYATLRWRTRE